MADDLSHLIQYRCVTVEHQRLVDKERVFVLRGGWAYCAAGKIAVDHSFISTGGLERRRVESGVQQRIGVRRG